MLGITEGRTIYRVCYSCPSRVPSLFILLVLNALMSSYLLTLLKEICKGSSVLTRYGLEVSLVYEVLCRCGKDEVVMLQVRDLSDQV